jgi:predicted RNA-binding protein associated with RNAse of E/G family
MDAMQTVANSTEIRSGAFDDALAIRDYRFERLGDVYVERVIWGSLVSPLRRAGVVVAGPGYVWFRFWMLSYSQVVERYYSVSGQPLGTQIDVCMPPVCDDRGYLARDLHLDIWIAPEGHVTLYGESSFDQAVRQGQLSPEEAAYAEEHVRRLTTAIAQGRFPPPIVRRWQVDASRIQNIVADPRQHG